MALDEEQKTIVALRKLVIKKIKICIEEDEVRLALDFSKMLEELPSYIDE